MPRKKKVEEKEKKEESVVVTNKDKIAKARKKRIALAEKREKVEKPSDSRYEFKKYFVKLKKKLNLKNELEEIIWTHLKQIKCDKKEFFEKGVKHFGYKI